MFAKAVSRFILSLSIAGVAFATLTTPGAAADPSGEELPLELQAVAANTSNVGPTGQTRIQITVERWSWSSDAERDLILAALREKGDRSVANALAKSEPVGWIRKRSELGEELRYAREIPLENGGRMILLALDRRLGFAEMFYGKRTLDYNVTLVQLTLDAEGKGSGQLILGAEFDWNEDKEQLTIEHFAIEPIRLNHVKAR